MSDPIEQVIMENKQASEHSIFKKKKKSCQSSSLSCDLDMKSHHFCILKVLQAHNSTLSAQYVQNRKMSHSITLQDVTIVCYFPLSKCQLFNIVHFIHFSKENFQDFSR